MPGSKLAGALRLVGEGPVTQIAAAATLKNYQADNVITAANSDDYDVTLPPCSETQGMIFTFFLKNTASSVTIGILGGTDSSYDSGHITAINDRVVVLSNGQDWIELANVTT